MLFVFFDTIYKLFLFLSVGDPNMRRPDLSWVSPPTTLQTFFIECDICHLLCKNVRALGQHKKENHFSTVKPKAHPGPLPLATKPPSPVSHGTVQKTPVTSPVLLPGQIACSLCKISCNDKNVLLGLLCDELNCNKVYISKSGLFKHKKTHVQEETDDSVLCMDCQQIFKTEADCDNHDCPALPPKKKPNDIQNPKVKTECPPENGEDRETSSNGKRRTRSKIKKEPL